MTPRLLSVVDVTQAELDAILQTQAKFEQLSAQAHPRYLHHQEFRPLAQQARAACARITAEAAPEITSILCRALNLISGKVAEMERKERASCHECRIGFTPSPALYGLAGLEAQLALSLKIWQAESADAQAVLPSPRSILGDLFPDRV